MSITATNRTITPDAIACGETFDITLQITASPSHDTRETDIALAVDTSSAVTPELLTQLKTGLHHFVTQLETAVGDPTAHTLGNYRLGLVSYGDLAAVRSPLTASSTAIGSAIDSLATGGSSNQHAGLEQAASLLSAEPTHRRILPLIAAAPYAGSDPLPLTDTIKTAGITILCLGCDDDSGPVASLYQYASPPKGDNLLILTDEHTVSGLLDRFADQIIASDTRNSGARGITVRDELTPCFRVLSVKTPSHGTAEIESESSTLHWAIPSLGKDSAETASVTYCVQHVGPCSGEQDPVLHSICTYNGEIPFAFPARTVTVDCGLNILPEPCPTPVDITIDSCTDTLEYDAGELTLDSLGRVLQLDVTLKNICPNRQVALAVYVSELDAEGIEYHRGLKTLLIPAHNGEICRDITVRCIRFILPEALDPSGNPASICNDRRFRARMFAHYIDTDFACCEDG